MEDRREPVVEPASGGGNPGVPDEFSVTFAHQTIPAAVLAEIDDFIRVFENVTTRPVWQENVIGSSGHNLPAKRPEVCFFSAWDFHLPPEGPWQVIEFNDNGSGLLYAGLINESFHALMEPPGQATLEAPPPAADLARRIKQMVRREAEEFFGAMPKGLFLYPRRTGSPGTRQVPPGDGDVAGPLSRGGVAGGSGVDSGAPLGRRRNCSTTDGRCRSS